MYDCITDPGQFHNIVNDHGYAGYVTEMRKTLNEWMVGTGDNIPDSITKDWYIRGPGTVKTENFGIRGEPVDKKYNATKNNNKGPF